jgi:hypothetical protein
MKKNYAKTIFAIPILLFVMQVYGDDVPKPDAFYQFNETTGNAIADSSGNNNHAWWYNYNGENPGETVRTGWRPTDGFRGGAGYFNGDHVYCGNSCSSGSDLVIFKTSEMHACDDDIPANNAIFQQNMDKFTVSFWYKNNWNYMCESGTPAHACYEDESGCAWERQVLFTMGGSSSGMVLETFAGTSFPALIRLTIAGGNKEQRVLINAHHPALYENEWVHYTVVFEGDTVNNTGKVRLYLDFELVNNGEKDTPFGKIAGHTSSVVFGAQAGNSVTDFNIDGECWGQVYELCGITAEQVGRLRYGWLARGWIDDFAFWASEALTKEQIVAYEAQLAEAYQGGGTYLYNYIIQNFKVVPSFATSQFRISGVEFENFNVTMYNLTGQVVQRYQSVHAEQTLSIPSDLKSGIYLVGIERDGIKYGVRKLVITNR